MELALLVSRQVNVHECSICVTPRLLTRLHKLVIVTVGIYSTYPSVLTVTIPSHMEVKIVARVDRVAVNHVLY